MCPTLLGHYRHIVTAKTDSERRLLYAVAMASNRERGPILTPDIDGPRVRVGIFWFLILLAAISSGVVWTAVLWAYVGAVAALQVLAASDAPQRQMRSSQSAQRQSTQRQSAQRQSEQHQTAQALPMNVWHLGVAVVTAAFPLMAAYNLTRAGWMLIIIPAPLAFLAWVLSRNPKQFTRTLMAIVLPALAAISVVATVQVSVWSALFLVVAVSLYDAGSFLIGAESGSRWEGPAAGILGIAATTFVFSILEFAPYTSVTALLVGVVLAIGCPLGQILVGAASPDRSPTSALRRLDSYVIAGPLFVTITWFL